MYEFGVDFIARCLAGEAINEAKKKQWKLVAGDNITLLDNLEDETTTISASDQTITVDDELSLTSENPVQNKVITDALRTKPTTVINTGLETRDQRIMQLTRAQFDAIAIKDPNTYYMITDDTDSYVIRTAYKPVDDYTTRVGDDGSYYITFEVPDDFEMIEARVNYSVEWSCGGFDHAVTGLTDTLTVTPSDYDPPRAGKKIYMGNVENQFIGTPPNQTEINVEIAQLTGANYITYNENDNTITIKIGKPRYDYGCIIGDEVDNRTLTVHNYSITELGYIAFGSDNINFTHDSYRAGSGIAISNNGVISISADYGASFELSLDSSTYEITAVLKDQNGNTLGQAQTIDLPLESVVVDGEYDSNTQSIILELENGNTITIPVSGLVSGLESTSNKVTSISSSSTNTEYPSAAAVYNAIDAIDELPASTAADLGKVLTVNASGDAEWTTPAAGVTDYDLLSHRPAINGHTLTGDQTGADLGLVVPTDLNDYLTSASAANTYQTQAGMSNYLSNATAASTYLSKTDAASDYLTKSDAASTYQPIGSYATQTDISDMATETWVGNQGYETSSHAASTYQTQAGMSSYATQTDIADMATETWVGQQGFLTSADEVPAVTSSDDGKILTASYTGGVGSYSWETAPSGGTSDYSQLSNKPSINNVTLSGNKTTSDLGIAEVPSIGSSDDGKVLTASYVGGTTSYSWQTASGGGSGLQVETDGTNYWITVNGIRLYFASSAPTGTIPTGSLGIGW